uniref:hypothetical protein n=1 Tax=Cellulosimicrobium cellulans TaxID=1710 RepID=UPI001112D11C
MSTADLPTPDTDPALPEHVLRELQPGGTLLESVPLAVALGVVGLAGVVWAVVRARRARHARRARRAA